MWIWTVSLRWFGNLPLKAKLYISFGWMSLFTFILGAICLIGIHRISSSYDQRASTAHVVTAPGQDATAASGNTTESISVQFESLIGGLTLFFLFLNFIMAWRLAHLISSPILNACLVLERLSNRDLTVRAKVESTDEAGRMCDALNRTICNLHNVLDGLMKNADALDGVAGQLADHVAQSVDQCKHQAELARQVLDSTRLVAAQEEAVVRYSHETAEAGRSSSDCAKNSSEIMGHATQTMDSAASASSAIVGLMSRLDSRSREITQVVTTIREISDTTHLLALNATIEAARAGEHGRGFAVVAGEVRSLADHTRAATEEISATIQNIQDESQKTVAAVQSSQASIEDGRFRTAEAHQILARIIEHATLTESLAEKTANAAQDQSVASRDIASNASQVAELATGSLKCSSEVAISMESIRSSARHLSDLVRQFKL